jgi:hypothetical protein
MKRVALAFLAPILFAASTLAQDAARKAPSPNPAASPSAALLKQWNEIGRKLIDMSEDFPENKYDFKAASSTKTFAERLIHVAASNYYFTNLALGQKPPAEDAEPPSTQFKNKPALIAYVRKSFADGAAAIKAKGDKGISDLVVDPFGFDDPQHAGRNQIRLFDLAGNVIEHSGEVYGQLSVPQYYINEARNAVDGHEQSKCIGPARQAKV